MRDVTMTIFHIWYAIQKEKLSTNFYTYTSAHIRVFISTVCNPAFVTFCQEMLFAYITSERVSINGVELQ